jgi:hypothetical protein
LLQVRAESTIGQNVDSAAKKVGEILFETDDVEERAILLDLHEQVEISRPEPDEVLQANGTDGGLRESLS